MSCKRPPGRGRRRSRRLLRGGRKQDQGKSSCTWNSPGRFRSCSSGRHIGGSEPDSYRLTFLPVTPHWLTQASPSTSAIDGLVTAPRLLPRVRVVREQSTAVAWVAPLPCGGRVLARVPAFVSPHLHRILVNLVNQVKGKSTNFFGFHQIFSTGTPVQKVERTHGEARGRQIAQCRNLPVL